MQIADVLLQHFQVLLGGFTAIARRGFIASPAELYIEPGVRARYWLGACMECGAVEIKTLGSHELEIHSIRAERLGGDMQLV